MNKAMTPHDELMALAGKATPGEWSVEQGGYGSIITKDGKSMAAIWPEGLGGPSFPHEANAAFIAAACNFVRSDAFRAMVRDAERLDFYTENQHRIVKSGGKWYAIIGQSNYAFFDTVREAIDAAASGAGGSDGSA